MPKRTAFPPKIAGPSMDKTGEFSRVDVEGLLRAEKPRARRAERINESVPRAARIEREGAEPLVLPLYPDRTYVFGRSAESTVVFPSDAVSRLHAQLRFHEDRWTFRDLNSRNGTFLLPSTRAEGDPRHGARQIGVKQEHRVVAGETVLLGNGQSRITFLATVPEDQAQRVTDGVSAATQRLERSIAVCSTHRLPVFLLGASGSGKTHVARTIHERARMEGHFVLLNCGRLPHDPAQLASELLGHVKGSFTGATADRIGRLWSADGGTLFLDEVESTPRAAQDFLLDVLEGSGSFSPYGQSGDIGRSPPRFRLVSASKAPLASSGLRPDLCQRLAAGDMIVLPSLKERAEDIPLLVETFLERLRVEQRLDAHLNPDAIRFLQETSWPGEIRELESTIKVVVNREHASRQLDGVDSQRIAIGAEVVKNYLEQRHLGFGGTVSAPAGVARAVRKRPSDLSGDEIEASLRRNGGNKTRAAAELGVAVNTLKARLRDL